MYIKTTRAHLDDALRTDKNEDSKSQSLLSSYDNGAGTHALNAIAGMSHGIALNGRRFL